MKPVFQKKLDDCFAACVASILEIDIETIPALQPEDYDNWHPYLNRVADFLVDNFSFGLCGWQGYPATPPQGYAIKTCRVDRGGESLHHAMVACDGTVVHDPCAEAPISDRDNPAINYIVFYAIQPSMQKINWREAKL